MNPTVSVIIPIYNSEGTLERCLESVMIQSMGDIEVICVLDGSTDGSPEIVKRHALRDDRVRVRRFEENKGTVQSLKLGLRESRGEYVMFVDSDDRLLPGAIENAVRQIREYGVDILQFGMKITALPGVETNGFERLIRQQPMTSEGANILYDCFSMHRFPHNIINKIFRGDLCRAAGAAMPDLWIRQFADLYPCFFFLYRAKTFRSVPDVYYEYMFGNGISTSSPNEKQFADICAASAILPAIEGYLKREGALENNRFLLKSIETILKSDVVNKLLTLPEITKEIIDLAVKSWGSEVIYDFIEATGLLDVTCMSRYKLIPVLVNQLRNEKKPPTTSIGKPVISVGGQNAAQPASGLRSAQKEDKK